MAQPVMSASSKDNVNCAAQTDCNVLDESWLTEIQSMFDSSNKLWQVSENVCIYRVPRSMTLPNPEAYSPFVVALGPYHHFNPEFSRMNSHKMEAVNRALTRLQMDVTTLISEIQKFEIQIRECYEEPISLDGNKLSWMLTMDACFILEYFRGCNPVRFSLVFQPSNTMAFAIMNDIMKLENQIPLFILLVILEFEFKCPERAATALATLLSSYGEFNGFPFSVSQCDISELKKHIEKESPPRHLLDLSRMVIKDLLISTNVESGIVSEREDTRIAIERVASSGNNHERCWRSMKVKVADKLQQLSCINMFPRPGRKLCLDETSIPSASSLGQAGIEFEPGNLEFKKGISGKSTLSLPQIHLWDKTETVLRNLMAYEECQNCSWYREDTIVTQLIILYEYLMTSEKDVSILRKSKVIMSLLGSDQDTAHMFNHLGNNHTLYPIQQIEEVKAEAREHYNSKWNMWISQLKEEYFSQPWSLISFVAAVLALVMTAVQTFYSIK